MNMMYSDYCRVAEKVGASSLDFYAYMAKAFLDDRDAAPNKLARYYHGFPLICRSGEDPGVAQLVARLVRDQEAVGSNPTPHV